MWANVIINFLLVISAYLFTIIAAIVILTLRAKSRQKYEKKRQYEYQVEVTE